MPQLIALVSLLLVSSCVCVAPARAENYYDAGKNSYPPRDFQSMAPQAYRQPIGATDQPYWSRERAWDQPSVNVGYAPNRQVRSAPLSAQAQSSDYLYQSPAQGGGSSSASRRSLTTRPAQLRQSPARNRKGCALKKLGRGFADIAGSFAAGMNSTISGPQGCPLSGGLRVPGATMMMNGISCQSVGGIAGNDAYMLGR